MGAHGVYAWLHGNPEGGVDYFRIMEPLRMVGTVTNVTWGHQMTPAELEICDTIVVHGLHDPERSETWQWLAKRGSHRLIIDIDDAVWAPDFKPMQQHYTAEKIERLYDNVAAAHVLTTPSAMIADHLSKYQPNAWVLPNTVPQWLTTWEMPARERPTLGFQGSDSHRPDWTQTIADHVTRFMREHPGWDIHTYGGFKVESESTRVRHTPWKGTIEDYWRYVSMDVGIGPLRDTRFNRAKSDLRAREYMALGIVPVLPYVRPYYGSFVDGHTGRYVYPHQTLSGVLREVARDPAHMAEMKASAREVARRDFTTEGSLERVLEAWTSA